MRILVNTLFSFLALSVCAVGNEVDTYYEPSVLGILVMILVPLIIFSGVAAGLYFSSMYSFGNMKYGFNFMSGGGSLQMWLLVIFAIGILLPSAFLLSPAILLGFIIIAAAVVAGFLFVRRRSRL